MCTNHVSGKEFATITKGANKEVKGFFTSPFVIVNLLNKAAKGDFSKIANCADLGRANIAKVAKACKALHAGRYHFDVCLFEKDYKGRFCTKSAFKGDISVIVPDYIEIGGISAMIYVDNKGREIVCAGDNSYVTLCPIKLDEVAYFNAFAKVAKVEIIASERAAKEAERAAKKLEKAFNAEKKGIFQDYNAGKFGEDILANKLTALREKYGK